jgi:hypothetical protein
MFAVCSDLDETPDRHVYRDIMRFLNTTDETSMGCGVGLEVGNTLYFDMPPDQYAYWNTDDAGRAMARTLISSGHIDCFHSYGDLATTRAAAARSLDELARYDCRMEVWIDHAIAATNFGADIMRGSGDIPGSPVYHADLTWGFGVRYVWRGRVTSVIGQDRPRRLGGIFRWSRPLESVRTLAKEVAKGALSRRPEGKYAMHGPNDVLRNSHLRDGRPVFEFLRSNPYWGGVQLAATADGVAEVLTPAMLACLTGRGGVCLLYTHLGKVKDSREPFRAPTRAAFRHLAESSARGEDLVATTRRVLGYCRPRRQRGVAARERGDVLEIAIDAGDRLDPDGLTFYIPEGRRVEVTFGGRAIRVTRNPSDHTGRSSVSIPWRRLSFPDV